MNVEKTTRDARTEVLREAAAWLLRMQSTSRTEADAEELQTI